MKNDIDSNFSLCSKTCKKITKKYGAHNSALDYPEAERVVALVWTVAGIVENGGFRYLFGSVLPGDGNYAITINAFKQIGCLNVAETIDKAVHIFPNGEPHIDDHDRVTWFEQQPEQTRNQLDTAFWNELDNITLSLARYIREHDEFRGTKNP
jgi:hypothetical protein